jgi:hypothetical protein
MFHSRRGQLLVTVALVTLGSCRSAPQPRGSPATALPDTFQRPLSSTLFWTLPPCNSARDCATAMPGRQTACVRGCCIVTAAQAPDETDAARVSAAPRGESPPVRPPASPLSPRAAQSL